MAVLGYRELIAWQKAMDLVVEVYRLTAAFPKSEMFGLTNQLRRCSVSIPSNIAEGQGRSTTKDFVHFLHIAKGSLQGVETQLTIASRLNFVAGIDSQNAGLRTGELARILNGLIRSLSPTDH